MNILCLTFTFPDGTPMGEVVITRTNKDGYEHVDDHLPFHAATATIALRVHSKHMELTSHNYNNVIMGAQCLAPFLQMVRRTFATQTCYQHLDKQHNEFPNISASFLRTIFNWNSLTIEACKDIAQLFGQHYFHIPDLQPINELDLPFRLPMTTPCRNQRQSNRMNTKNGPGVLCTRRFKPRVCLD